jgi:post-segregation antitoxin (ccd killing protein)
MGKVKKLSVTVDEQTLEEIRRLAPHVTVSFLIDDALKQELTRMRLKALLDEMEARNPISEEGRREGDRLWEQTVSYWTLARSQRSPKKKAESAATSSAQSKKKRKLPSPRS